MTRDYVGRVNGPAKMKNFRGMNPASSEINQDPNGALSMVNCDISTIGSVKMRKGWTAIACAPALPNATVDGVIDLKTDAGEALVVFCNGKVFRVVGLVSTDITAANVITPGYRWRGCQSHDSVFMANGVDQPLVIALTGNAITYSQYSKNNSTSPAVAATVNAAPDTTWNSTAHGRSNGDQVQLQTSGSLPTPFLINTTYFVVGAAANTFQLSLTSGGTPITYTTSGSGAFTFTWVGHDDTPSSWVSKPPHGFVLLNQLAAERMWAWNLETVFYSALYSPWDYLSANNAGFLDVRPGDGDNVSVVTGSYGFIAVMTMYRTLIYKGTGPTDISIDHVLTVGCMSPDAVVPVGDDIHFLSLYGPTTLQRTMYGMTYGTQLVNQMIGFQIAPMMHDTASMDGWGKCVCYHDINFRRVIWWLPQGDVPNQGFIYQYDVKSWPGTWEGWSINCVTHTSANLLVAGSTGGQLMILSQGGDDNGTMIQAHYTTAWIDKNEPERNMTCPFLEIWLRASSVQMSVTATWDYGETVDTQDIIYGTDAGIWGNLATDPVPNVNWWGPWTVAGQPEGLWQDTSFARTRVDIYGIGRVVQFTFNMNGSGDAEILAYRPDLRSKGLL